MNTSRKRIFLTGKSGFIGKNLEEFLSSRYELFSPDHSQLELLDSKAVEAYFRKHSFDLVIHSAAAASHRKIKEPKDIVCRNLRMFFNIARNQEYFSRMIFLGSGAEYDYGCDLCGVNESNFDRLVPQDENGFSKYVCSQYIERSDKIINLRLFGIFGKYEDYQIRFISNAICKAIFDLPITLKQNRVFSYLYINDFLEIIPYFIEQDPKFKAYNLAGDEKSELLSIAEKVKIISGKKLDIVIDKPGLGKEYTADNSRLKQEVRRFKFTPLEVSIEKLYRWYQDIKGNIDVNLLHYDP